MSIKSMTISNFKGIKDEVKIDFKPITLLFGPNSAGKSTIIQALHYAYEAIGRRNFDAKSSYFGGQAIDFGGFKNIVNDHDLEKTVSMRFDIDLNGIELSKYANDEFVNNLAIYGRRVDNIYRWNPSEASDDIQSVSVELTIGWDKTLNKVKVVKYKSYFNNELIGVMECKNGKNKPKITFINFCHPLLSLDTNYRAELEKYIISKEDSFINKELNIGLLGDLCLEALGDLVERGLDFDNIPDRNYKILQEAIELRKPLEKKHNEFIDFLKDGNTLEEARNIIAFPKQLYEQQDKAIKHIVPYEFWLYCREFFSLKELNGDLSIACLDQEDALPDFKRLLNIKPIEDSQKVEELIGGDSHWYFPAIQSAISQIFLSPVKLLNEELQKLLYIGPIRNRIPRNYEPDSYIDNKKWSDGIAAWDVMHKGDQDFFQNLNFWMVDRLRTGYLIDKRPDSTLRIINNENQVELRPIDVGVGVSQVLPVVVASLYSKQGIVAIEQPELHIHPALQVELGDLFLSQAENKDICFLIETHSEHLLLRLMKRLRESFEKPEKDSSLSYSCDDISVLYVETYKGRTIARKMPLNEKGELVKAWPGGFFEEDFREIF